MNIVKFREQAIRARRLAFSVGDMATSETLHRYAEVCDARAAAIEVHEVVIRGKAGPS